MSGADPAIQRLLFVVDATVANIGELPPEVRAVIGAAPAVYVLTPTLPGRLAWLADDVDKCRHVADERLDTVMDHLHAIDANVVAAAALRGSVLTVIADAVAEFHPDHILLAMRSSEHANWQESGLVEHVEERFGVAVTAYAVDREGHTTTADGPLLLCYDGSEDATHAIERAGAVFAGREALVLTVWHPATGPGSLAWAGAEVGGRVASDGVRVARAAGLDAEPMAVEATGRVWETIVETAERTAAATIVMGSRGLTGLRSMLVGSVSSAVLRHADRPTLVVRQPADAAVDPP